MKFEFRTWKLHVNFATSMTMILLCEFFFVPEFSPRCSTESRRRRIILKPRLCCRSDSHATPSATPTYVLDNNENGGIGNSSIQHRSLVSLKHIARSMQPTTAQQFSLSLPLALAIARARAPPQNHSLSREQSWNVQHAPSKTHRSKRKTYWLNLTVARRFKNR